MGSILYLIGGRDAQDQIIDEIDYFDTRTNMWSTSEVLWPDATSEVGAFILNDTKVYIVGGYTQEYESVSRVTVMEVPNPDSPADIVWHVGSVAPMNQDRGDLVAVSIDGKGYAAGGFSSASGLGFCSPLCVSLKCESSFDGVNSHNTQRNVLEVYDPVSNTWSTLPRMIIERGDKAGVRLGGRLYIIGGERKRQDPIDRTCSHSIPVNDVEVYDPPTRTWTQAPDLTDQRFRFTGAYTR